MTKHIDLSPDVKETSGLVHVVYTTQAAPPITVTRANCLQAIGIEPKKLRAHLDRLGVPYVSAGHEIAADLEVYRDRLRQCAQPPRVRVPRPKPSPHDDDETLLAQVARRRGQ